MFLGGLWHGASWMFVIWGLLHGFYLVVEHAAKSLVGDLAVFRLHSVRVALGLLTFVIVSMTWVFFRAPDMTVATTMLTTMATPTETGSLIFAERLPVIGLVLLGLLGWHWTTRNSNLELVFEQLPVWLRALIISAVVMTITFSGGGAQHAFIYFQF